MVRAMDLTVTVGAAPVKKEDRGPSPRSDRVTSCQMTLCANPWVSNFEQPVVYRAVRLMAIGAILNCGSMLPEERSASFCMAHETGLIDARLFELGRIRSPVRVVAVSAGQLPFSKRHVGRTHELGFPLQMALAADLYLRSLVKKGRLVVDLGELEAVGGFLHDRVAVGANNSTSGMRACFPVGLHSLLMALEASVVLDLGGHW